MAVKIIFCIALCVLTFTNVNGLQAVNGRVKITIGTTSGCSDTVNFINNQLSEAITLYGNFLDIEFVPWGKTVRNADGSFTCQFGNNDCWANRLHRCALNMLKDNQAAQIHYMNCEFNTPYPSYLLGTYLCAQGVGLNLVNLDYCVANPGDELDIAAQEAAREPMSTINFVPSIHFNDQVDVSLHNEARTRLPSMICFALAEDSSTGVSNCRI